MSINRQSKLKLEVGQSSLKTTVVNKIKQRCNVKAVDGVTAISRTGSHSIRHMNVGEPRKSTMFKAVYGS